MTNSKAGSKLAQNLRRAKGQQNPTEETPAENAISTKSTGTAAKKESPKPAKPSTDTTSFKESRRVWPD